MVYEDEEILAFNDINPQAPIHVLVIPKEKIKSFDSIENSESNKLGNYMKKIALIARKLKLSEKGYRIVFNHGSHGQQTVNYIHAHILGARQLNWPPG